MLRFTDSGSVTLRDFFTADGTAETALDRIVFADGTVWTAETVRELAIRGTDTGAGSNRLYGYSSDDVINGLAGDDVIYAGAGNDRITGGRGDDQLHGGTGADVYRYARGDGSDVIISGDRTAQDRLELIDIRREEVRLTNHNGSLQLELPDGAVIRVQHYFTQDGSTGAALKTIAFADTELDIAQVKDAVLQGSARSETLTGYAGGDVINAGAGDDAVYGYAGADTLNGGAGNDRLEGGYGNDTLDGGTGDDILTGGRGNDILIGGAGSDIYRWNRGDGDDVIRQNGAGRSDTDILEISGINPFAVTLHQDGNHLILALQETGNTLTLENYFSENTHNISAIHFSNGVQWQTQDILSRLPAVSTKDDILYSSSYDDDFAPQSGNDTIIYHPGDGHDRYVLTDSTAAIDTLFLKGASPKDVQLSRTDDDLIIRFAGDEHSSITIIGHYRASADGIDSALDTIRFTDGTIWPQSYINYLGNGGTPSQAPQAADVEANIHAITAIAFATDLNRHFMDADNDRLRYHVRLANGEPLPAWLSVDADGVLSGTAPLGTESLSLQVIATDPASLSASKTLTLDLTANQAPIMLTAQENISTRAGENINTHVNLAAIMEKDGEAVRLALSQSNGEALPAWLQFDSQTGLISGNAPQESQTLHLQLTATDTAGLSSTDIFTLSINGAPQPAQPISRLHAEEGSPFSLQLPLNTFQDPENDPLHFHLSQADGSALPAWLHFDPLSGTLTGTAPIGSENLTLQLHAADSADNHSSTDIFLDLTAPPEHLQTPWYGGEIRGKDGDDTLEGSWFIDTLIGGAGNDTLDGKAGADTLYGGRGNDILNGGWGDDIYHYAQGDGKDTIIDAQGSDSLIFAGIESTAAGLKRSGNDLIMVFKNQAEDQITLQDWYQGQTVETLRFADKTLTYTAIEQHAASLLPLDSPRYDLL